MLQHFCDWKHSRNSCAIFSQKLVFLMMFSHIACVKTTLRQKLKLNSMLGAILRVRHNLISKRNCYKDLKMTKKCSKNSLLVCTKQTKGNGERRDMLQILHNIATGHSCIFYCEIL